MTKPQVDIPPGWEKVRLEDIVLKIVGGGTPSRNVHSYFQGNIPWFTVKDMKELKPSDALEHITHEAINESATNLIPANTISLATRIALGKAIKPSIDYAINQDLKALFLPKGIHPDFILYWIVNNERRIQEMGSGTTVLGIRLESLNALDILLPPEKEQKRIIEKLEELLSDLDDGVAELKAAQAKLMQYRQSLLKSAVEGSLTAEWRAKNKPTETGEQLLKRILAERRKRWEKQKLVEFREKGQTPPKDWQKKYPEPVAPDASELPELPEGWVWASLDQCTADAQGITDGPFGSNLKTAHYTKSGPRVIRLQNIGEGIFHDDKAHISETHYLELTKHSIESGDTVVAMMGEVLPRACTIPDGVAPGIVKADCARVRVNKSLIEPDLLPYFLNSEPVRQRTKALVKGIGRPRINLSHIRAIAIPVAPKLEQIKMLELFRSYNSSIDAQLSELDRSLLSANAQRKNILKEAFEGRLVTQDPKDGTAAQLLHNIKINRDKFDKEPKPGRSKKGRIKGRQTMKKLEDVLAASKDWLKAEDAFKECGATDGTSTAVIEELYYELRALDKKKRLDVQRRGDSDWLRLKDGSNR